MADYLLPHVSITAMPLRSYWASLPPEDRPKYDALEELARDGKLCGTYKQGRMWFINLLAHAQLGLQSENSGTTEEDTEDTDPTPPEGNGGSDPKGKRLVRARPKERKGDLNGGLRNRRKGTGGA